MNLPQTKFEKETGEVLSDAERIGELAAEFFLECQEKWKCQILDRMSDEEIRDYIQRAKKEHSETCKGIPEPKFIGFCALELQSRYAFRRSKELGTPYCVFHDCKLEECPEGFHSED